METFRLLTSHFFCPRFWQSEQGLSPHTTTTTKNKKETSTSPHTHIPHTVMAASLRFCPECNFLLKARGVKETYEDTTSGTTLTKTRGQIVYWCQRGEDVHPQKQT